MYLTKVMTHNAAIVSYYAYACMPRKRINRRRCVSVAKSHVCICRVLRLPERRGLETITATVITTNKGGILNTWR